MLRRRGVTQTECVFLQFRFELVWFAVFILDWFGFEHP